MDLVHYAVVNVCLFILGFLVFLIVKNYYPSYFSAKGKNLADKEDIAEITQQIEAVKALHTKEVEQLRSQLSHFSMIQSSHRTEERNAIIEFYVAYYHWLYTIFEIPMHDYNTGNIDKIAEKNLLLNEYFIDINKASAKLVLLVKNAELVILNRDLIVNLVNYKSWTEQKLINLSYLLIEKSSLSVRFGELIKNMDKNMEEAEKAAQRDTELTKKIQEFNSFYFEEKLVEFKKCLGHCTRFEVLAKEYLTTLN